MEYLSMRLNKIDDYTKHRLSRDPRVKDMKVFGHEVKLYFKDPFDRQSWMDDFDWSSIELG